VISLASAFSHRQTLQTLCSRRRRVLGGLRSFDILELDTHLPALSNPSDPMVKTLAHLAKEPKRGLRQVLILKSVAVNTFVDARVLFCCILEMLLAVLACYADVTCIC